MPEATVATFNIRHGRGLDGRVDLERIAEVIERTRADLIALQEIDRFDPRSGDVDQPRELERLTGMRVVFMPTVARTRGEYGTALATRGSALADATFLDLPRIAGEEPRRVVSARWRALTVVATHLAVGDPANAAQQQALAELAAPLGPRVVVLGDLNARRRRLGRLLRAGLTPARPSGGTLHPWWRFKQIDHILAGPGVRMLRAHTVATTASDHRPVVVSLRWGVEDVVGVTYDG